MKPSKPFCGQFTTAIQDGTHMPLFYAPSAGTTRVSRCQKRSSGLYGARED